MTDEKKKMTAHGSSVGADDGQSISQNYKTTIPDLDEKSNYHERDLEELYRKMRRMSAPTYLHTVTLDELMDNVFEGKSAVIENLLYTGAYILAGAPKIGKLKQFADRYGVCVLIVHHTRKQPAGDSFEMISGTTGLLGCADGALLMQKEKRTDSKATLEVVGRDQPDQRLYLSKDQESLVWGLDHAENELWKQPPDPILEAVAKIVSSENREWEGSPTELAQAIQTDMAVNRLTKHLNVNASRLLEEHQVKYENKTKHAGRRIRLTYMVVEAPAFEVIG